MHDVPARPFVVASMIVRDEEALLADCLSSLSSLVDEIVVCDTGSTDTTIEIAKAHGATVVEAPWSDDFSAARNLALDASRHGRWVLWVDADERLHCDDPAALVFNLESTAADAIAVEIKSRRSDGPTSIGLATRLFRADAVTFVGAVHEQVVRVDGRPLDIGRSGLLRIDHVGYDDSVVPQEPKRERNARIAKRQHELAPSPKTALDLARSLAATSRDAADTLSTIRELVNERGPSDPAWFPLRTLEADFALKAGELEAAIDVAREIIHADAGNDVAVAVLARAAVDAGRSDELVAEAELIEKASQHASALAVPANRALALTLLSAELAVRGDSDGAQRTAQRALTLIDDGEVVVAMLLDAYSDLDPGLTARTITSLPRVDAPAIIASLTGSETIDREEPSSGITLDFGDLEDDAEPRERVLAAIPACRRVAVAGDVADWQQSLEEEGHTVVDHRAAQDVDAFDVLILDPSTPNVDAGMIEQLDTSGLVLTWPTDDHPVGQTVERLEEIGLMQVPGPGGVLALRPVWTPERLGPRHDPAEFTHRLAVAGIGSPDQAIALRASLPSFVEVITDESDVRDDDLVLHLVPSVMPEPGWVQALWDEARDSGQPVGCRVVGTDGETIVAGFSDGRWLGHAEPAGSTLLTTDRRDVELSPPFIAEATQAGPSVRGHIRSDVVAVSPTGYEKPTRPGGLRDLFPRTAVLLGGSAPGHHHPEDRAVLEKTFDVLIAEGVTPVYQWDERQQPDPDTMAVWRRRGVLMFAPPPPTNELRPDPVNPQPAAIVQGLAPGCVIYLTANVLGTHFRPTTGAATSATQVYAGHQPATEVEGRLDATIPLAELPDQILELFWRVESSPEPMIPPIEPVEAAPGLTSIVIPVFNKAALTEACLHSIERHTKTPFEVIVVDNGSSDETGQILAAHPEVRVVRNDENRGFPAAVNQGIAEARGEFVCVLNNDTEVTSGWLTSMLKALEIDGTGMVGPRTNEIGGLQRVPGALPPTDGKRAYQWAWKWAQLRRRQTWSIDRAVGFCFVMRHDTYQRVGGLDEAFGIGNFEDDDLCRRVQEAGLTLRIADDSFVLHHGSATFSAMNVDLAARLQRAGRTLAARGRPSRATTSAIVLSDGQAVAAVATAASAQLIADDVRILERSAVASTELAAAAFGSIVVIGADWSSDDGSSTALDGLDSRLAVVLEAGERVVVDDWGTARSELDALEAGPVNVSVQDGAEVRLVASDPASVSLVGGQSPLTFDGFSIDRF